MAKDFRILVFSATYNEIENIARFCEGVFDQPVKCDLLVVDDSSPDGTGDELNNIAQQKPQLHVIHSPSKEGLGSAHWRAMQFAIEQGYDYLITMDADLSHDPADIASFVEAVNEGDFVIGSRFMKGGSCDYTGYRQLLSQWANRLARFFLGIGLSEYTTSYRIFRVSKLREFDFMCVKSQGYSFFLEMLFHLHKQSWRMSEIPIHFRDRVRGESKIPPTQILNGIWKLLLLILLRLVGRGR